MLAALRQHHVRPGNGGSGEYAFLTHVRNAAGFQATRTIDGLSLSLWPSRGHVLTGYEVKISRADWLRELKDPAKADDVCGLVDHFAVVAPVGVVQADEVPAPWGWLEVSDNQRVRTKKRPAMLHVTEPGRVPLDRGFVVAMLRSAGAAAVQDNDQARIEQLEKRADGHRQELQETVAHWRQRCDETDRILAELQRASGVAFGTAAGWDAKKVREVGLAIRQIVNGDQEVERAKQRLGNVGDQLRALAVTVENGGHTW